MTSTQGTLAGLSRFIFRAPSWYASVGFSLLIAALAGIAAFDSRFVLEDAWQGVFFIGVPTVVASVLTPWVDRRMGGNLTPNRASLLALFCELLVVAVMLIAGVVAVLASPGGLVPLNLDQVFVFDALIAALGAVFALRLLAVMAVSQESMVRAAVPASIQTAAAAVLLFVYSGTARFLEIGGPLMRSYLSRPEQAPPELLVVVPTDFPLLAGICVIYAVAAKLFLVIIDNPWKRSLGVSVLDFARGFIGHLAEGSRELEDFFEEIGEEAVVPVSVLSFRSRVDTDGGAPAPAPAAASGAGALTDRPQEATGREKARFVLPMIHPGPMGEIGGGNLPERVATSADGLAFPPHATAGHDFNLVTEREVDAVLDAAEDAYDRIEYGATATASVRTEDGDASVLGQSFGDSALLVATYAPGFADDVEYAVGLSAAAEARSSGLGEVMLVDAHNSNDGLEGDDLGHVTPGSKRSFDMIQAAGRAGERLSSAEQAPLELGVAWDPTDWDPIDGIGPLGVRVAVLDAGGQRTAYVLVDGNNMEPGLRGAIVGSLVDADGPLGIDAAEVMTTDTHIVNTVEAANQVGAAIDHRTLIDIIGEVTAQAVDDLEPVEAGMATERAEVTVFGNDRTETLASHANAMISIGGALAAAFVLVVAAISALLFLLTP
jgi:putative membrane protein